MLSVSRRRTCKEPTKQTKKDRSDTQKRAQENEARWPAIRPRLQNIFGASLLRKDLLAEALKIKTLKLDRLAKRSRICLLCWFCENWTVIEPLLPSRVVWAPNGNGSDTVLDTQESMMDFVTDLESNDEDAFVSFEENEDE
jgi:hypothetical protein